MSFISPLEELAEKFNIINYNIRELLHKLSIWKDTTSDSVKIRIKTKDEPYFENYSIPSRSFIESSGKKSNWNSFKPEGTKNWGSTITSDEYVDEVDPTRYVINIDSYDSAKTHFMEYVGPGLESNVTVSLENSGSEVNSILEFVLTVNPSVTKNTGEYFVYFLDNRSKEVLIKLGKHDLVNMLEGQPFYDGREYPKTFKVSFQYVIKPGYTVGSWEIFDLYQFPRYQYSSIDKNMIPINV